MGVGQFVYDLLQASKHTILGASAAEIDMRQGDARMSEAVESSGDWTVLAIASVLVAADPVTLIGRDDAAKLYLGIAEAIFERTESTGDRGAASIRKGFEAGIDALPGDVRVFIKRRALKLVPAQLVELAGRASGPSPVEQGPA